MEKQRTNLFIELVSILQRKSNEQFKLIAEEAGVTTQTLNNWAWGETFNPHLNTIIKVSGAMGYEITMHRKKPQLRQNRKAA